jgi:glycosyltransferase involved in cell wall biosynthesis
MKLLISLSYYSPYVSGVTLYAKNLAEAFVKENTQVTILTSRHDNNLPLEEKKNDVHIVRVPVELKISKGPIMFGLFKKCVPLIRNTDVLNCHLPQFESSLLVLVAKCFGKKVIVTYHTDLADEKQFFKRLIKQVLTLSQMITCLLADAIVVQTKDNANHSTFLSHFRQKLVFIYPPVPTPVHVTESIKMQMSKRMGSGDFFRIGFLGRIAQEKGLEYLFEALPLVEKQTRRKCHLMIAGPKETIGEQVYKEKIIALAQNEKDSIVFLGLLTEEEKSAFYSLLDVLVLPSINTTEAFGMVQVEAMYSGTPVVSTNLPGVRVPIQETGMGELVEPKDTKAISEAISAVLQNKKKYVKTVSVIQKNFSTEKVLKAYEKLFIT